MTKTELQERLDDTLMLNCSLAAENTDLKSRVERLEKGENWHKERATEEEATANALKWVIKTQSSKGKR